MILLIFKLNHSDEREFPQEKVNSQTEEEILTDIARNYLIFIIKLHKANRKRTFTRIVKEVEDIKNGKTVVDKENEYPTVQKLLESGFKQFK